MLTIYDIEPVDNDADELREELEFLSLQLAYLDQPEYGGEVE